MDHASYRFIGDTDRRALAEFIDSFWHSDRMVARGRLFHPAHHEGFIAEIAGNIVGCITFERQGDALEITLLDSRERQQGIGARLLEMAVAHARAQGCQRVWLVTTNDNIRAIRFYQKRGFDLVKIYHNAMNAARRLKPEIPATGQEGIPIRHELEFEMVFT